MRISLLSVILLVICSVNEAYCQVYLYRTFEEYEQDMGEEFDDHLECKHGTLKVKLILRKNGRDTLVDVREHWGFRFRQHLFRIDQGVGKYPIHVASAGKVIYYEWGPPILEEINGNSSYSFPPDANFAYISKNLNSQIHIFPDKRLNKKYPEYQELFECMGYDRRYFQRFISCAEKFNKEHQ